MCAVPTALSFAYALLVAAEPGSIDLIWEAPAGCATRDDGADAIRRYLARPLTDIEADLSVSVLITPGARDYDIDLRVRVHDDEELTRIRGEPCDVLAGVAALKIAMAIDPIAVSRNVQEFVPRVAATDRRQPSEADEPPLERVPPPAHEPVTLAPEAHSIPADRPAPLRFGLRQLTAAGWGHVPGTGLGLGLVAALFGPAWRAELGATLWPSRFVGDRQDVDVGGQIRLLTAQARACGVPARGPVEFPVCGGLEAGVLHGRGVGLPQGRNAREPWIATSLSPAVVWRAAPRVAVWAYPDLLVPVVRSAFAIEGREPLYRVPSVAGRVSVALELRLP